MKEGKELSPEEVEYYDRQQEIAKSLKFTINYDELRTQIDEATARVYFDVISEVDPEYNDNVVVRLDMNKKDGKWCVSYFVDKKFMTAEDKFMDYYDKGLASGDKGNSQQAIEYFTKAIIADTDNIMVSSVYHEIGLVYFDMKDYERAAMSFEIANEGELKFAKSYFGAGIAYVEMKEYERAIESYRRAIEVDPDLDIVYAYLGLAYQDMEDYDKATEYFKEAAKRGNQVAQDILKSTI